MTARLDRPPRFAATLTRRALLEAGALVVGFGFAARRAWRKRSALADAFRNLPLDQVDSFLAIRGDGTVVVYSGKVDLGTGHRIAMRQMVGEELAIGVDRIELIEGDTALTPNQGPTAGSSGIMRGGVELRQAAATAREALLALAAERLQLPVAELTLADGEVRAGGGRRVAVATLFGERGFDVKMNPKAPLKQPVAVCARRQVAAAARRSGQGHRPTCLRARPRRSRHAARPRAATAGSGREGRGDRRVVGRRPARRSRGAHRRFRRRRRRRRVGGGARGARAQGPLERRARP